MRMVDLIEKKKNGEALTNEEIQWMIAGYTKGEIPDYQMSAMCMAIYFQGMTMEETITLTMAMRDSGDVLDLSGITGVKVDKHSTGGVGDKTTLALGPIVASLGVPVAKMSGRGLGHTGGTIDKMECFPGLSTSISEETFKNNVNNIGIAVAGQTANLAPADKKLYALRDTTACVNQMSLIASSIMSKKLASGSDAIVLDVKVGNGAFMEQAEDAKALAQIMVDIGKGAGKQTHALITNMEQPLGYAVGNSVEVLEAIETLQGKGPEDFLEVVYALGKHMLLLAGKASSEDEALEKMKETIQNGNALKKLRQFVEAQGGDPQYVDDPSLLPLAKVVVEVPAPCDGYVAKLEARPIGHASMLLGGGRATKDSDIDLSVGCILRKKIGDTVKTGESLCTIYARDEASADAAKAEILGAYEFSDSFVAKPQMILAELS